MGVWRPDYKDTLSQRINYSTWKSNLIPDSTWNSNPSLVFNLELQFQWGSIWESVAWHKKTKTRRHFTSTTHLQLVPIIQTVYSVDHIIMYLSFYSSFWSNDLSVDSHASIRQSCSIQLYMQDTNKEYSHNLYWFYLLWCKIKEVPGCIHVFIYVMSIHGIPEYCRACWTHGEWGFIGIYKAA